MTEYDLFSHRSLIEEILRYVDATAIDTIVIGTTDRNDTFRFVRKVAKKTICAAPISAIPVDESDA